MRGSGGVFKLQPFCRAPRSQLMATDTATRPPRRRLWIPITGICVAAVIALVIFWNWNWFLPLVNREASSALGRPVTAQSLDVHLGRTTTVELGDVQVATVEGFDPEKPLAKIAKLTVVADVMAYIHDRSIVIPQIIVDQPVVEAVQDPSGKDNYTFDTGSSSAPSSKNDPKAGPRIGQLVINDGHAHVIMPKLKSDFTLDVSTKQPGDVSGAQRDKAEANGGQIVVGAKGTYAGQPVTGTFVGGALLSLREAANPYPIDLRLANGPTHITLLGTVQNPLNFAGANLNLDLAGPDMALLFPLTGIPIPQTPAYSVAGKLDYADKKVRFTGFKGRLGSSDLNGDIFVDPTRPRTYVEATLVSHRVDLPDLGGFIGTAPGRKGTPNQSAAEKQQLAKAEASPRIIPDTPINLPKVNAADVQLHYKGDKIEGESVPFDTIMFNLNIDDGRIKLAPLSLGVGTGDISLTADLAPQGKEFKTDAKLEVHRIDLGRMLESTHLVKGAGTMSGSASLDSTGNSLATLLGHGNGTLKVGMSGGNLSALLVDIAGLEVGNALLSALGIPQRADLQCFVGDFALQHGVLNTKTLLLDTSEARVQGTGDIDLSAETITYKLKTDSKHFSVGTLSTPIDVTGHLKSPSIMPEAGPLALKAGAAVGLGFLFPPAAIIPTIQFGVGDDGACQRDAAPIAQAVAAAKAAPVRHEPVRRPSSKR